MVMVKPIHPKRHVVTQNQIQSLCLRYYLSFSAKLNSCSGTNTQWKKQNEPTHEKRDLSRMRFAFIQTRMRSNPVEPDLQLFVWSFF